MTVVAGLTAIAAALAVTVGVVLLVQAAKRRRTR
jgi:hypothetical protein